MQRPSVVAWLLLGVMPALGGVEIPELMKAFDHAMRAHDAEACVVAIAAIQREQPWSFGAGVGPLSAESLVLRYVRMAGPELLDQDGRIAPGIGRQRSDESERWLVEGLVVTPDDTGVIGLLRAEAPVLRWLGLRKAEIARLGDDQAVIEAVRYVAATDLHVLIGRQALPPPADGNPLPLHAARAQDFFAPLRDEAQRLLTTWGKPPPEQGSLAAEGIAMLVKHHRHHQRDVLLTIHHLDRDSPIRAMITAAAMSSTGDDRGVLMEFITALERFPR